MAEWQTKSFSEVAVVEAVARQANVYLVIQPIRPGAETRLCSRFLSLNHSGDLVLEAPGTQTDRKKVFLPIGWEVLMKFPVGDFLLQAPSRVLGHCQYARRPARRIDAIVVERVGKVACLNRRKHPRREIDPAIVVAASVWPVDALRAGRCPDPRTGVLANRSRGGLGIRLDRPLPGQVGCEVIVRLEDRSAESCTICRAVLKHCTPVPDGKWLAGLGNVVELGPGQAVPLMESLLLPRT